MISVHSFCFKSLVFAHLRNHQLSLSKSDVQKKKLTSHHQKPNINRGNFLNHQVSKLDSIKTNVNCHPLRIICFLSGDLDAAIKGTRISTTATCDGHLLENINRPERQIYIDMHYDVTFLKVRDGKLK